MDDDSPNEDYNVQSLDNGSVLNAADKDQAASRRKSKGKEVPAAQAWDIIQAHRLVKQGLVHVSDVCVRFKGAAECDRHEPVFEESTIWLAVEDSRWSGGDELI